MQLGRRSFLQQAGLNFGALAAGAMLGDELAAAEMEQSLPHFAGSLLINYQMVAGVSIIQLDQAISEIRRILAGLRIHAMEQRQWRCYLSLAQE